MPESQFVLHGSWSDSAFFVWAEHATRAAALQGRPAGVPQHPNVAQADDLCQILRQNVPLGGWDPALAGRRVIWLPSSSTGPLLPPWFASSPEPENDEQDIEIDLQPWRVPGLELDVLSALDLLVAIPAGPKGLRGWGADLVHWAWTAKFALEILVKQKVIPGIAKHDGQYTALWLPVLADPADRARLQTLAEAMPPACRALFADLAVPPQPVDAPPADELLDDFVQACIDLALRDWGKASRSPPRPGPAGISAAWWAALWSDDPTIQVPVSQRRQLAETYTEWRRWAGQLQEGADQGYRLCFRLEAPDTALDGPQLPSTTWSLSYMLQATDDPSLLIPAEKVWNAPSSTLRYLRHRFEGAQERLLAGLGMASRTFAPITASLRTARPSSCALTAEEAFAFLRETAPLLEASGFGVLVPPWTSKRDARLAVRAKIKGQANVSHGILNMQSLVAFEWELALGDQTLSRQEFERLAALKTPLVQVRGKWVMLQPDEVEAAIAFWEKKRLQDHLPLTDALGIALGAVDESDGLPLQAVESTGWLDELLQTLKNGEQIAELATPDGFVGILRPYQRRGFAWLAFLRRWGLGACLADDMGLGKTIQAIALLLQERQRAIDTPNAQRPALVICPTSVVGNWKREIERFAPQLRVLIHHGGDRARADEFVAASNQHDVVISTYGLARRDIDELTQVQWSDVILDEAQNIKNPQAKQSQAIRKLPSANRIALTGTPVENRLSELWSIMQFLNPGLLGSQARFRKRFALPIERYQDTHKAGQLKQLVGPFILRRLKTDETIIQDLPEKMELKVYCNLTAEQATLYQAVVKESMERVEASGESSFERRGIVLGMLMRLKQVCNHPAQFLKDSSELPGRSGKLDRLSEMLEEALDVGDRALIFTQFAEMGHMLHAYLQSLFGIEVLYLHGGTAQKQRDRMIDRFQGEGDAPPVFVLSLKAGGTGLNLTAANHVFHYDRWWNPAVENQATDRAFRIGQRRNVQVHKLICAGTLEERIDALIESKRALAESVIDSGESWLTELSTDQLAQMVALSQD